MEKHTDMDTDDGLNDDLLATLIRKMPLESPSDDFVNRVMGGITPLPQDYEEKKYYYLWARNSAPYILGALILALFFFSSDIPYLSFLHGGIIRDLLVQVFVPLWHSLKLLVSSKAVNYSLLIGISAGFLFIADKLFSRRFSA